MVIRQILIFLILLSSALPIYANVSAKVDRAVIEEGETFVLTFKSDDEEPDLKVLNQFFNVLGTSRNSKMSFINGKMSSEKEWVVTLSPKKSGVTVIPGIVAGNEKTAPIRVQVVKAKVLNASQGADIFLEVKLDESTAYVQSQVIYIARLYRAVEIRDGSLTEPKISAAVVERMGEDVTFQTTRNQRRYQVTERRFALFPQQSGDLAIPPTVFDGQVLLPRQGRRTNDPFDRFFQSQQRAKRVQIKSDALVLEVLPQPANFNGKTWLPAKRLVLTETWSKEPPEFKVGEPITRTLKLEAIGQTGAQLPEFKESPAHGIKQYVDQPKVETGLFEGSLFGVREEKFAIIPTSSGKLVLPEVKLYWWDTELDIEKTVTIPPRIIDVAAADIVENQTANTIPINPVETQSNQQEKNDFEGVLTSNGMKQAGFWPWLALLLGVGWLLTVISWIMKRNTTANSAQKSIKPLKRDDLNLKEAKNKLKRACNDNDAAQAKHAILLWAKSAWPEGNAHSLIAVGKRLHDSTVTAALTHLDTLLYSAKQENWDGKQFWADVGQRLKKPQQKQKNKIKSLPSLYPN